ncbi:MAG: hypothetical protein IT328_18005 [Caldilineaceae bacterium]|nr:hypothetical protein [Caldilineaceae bacterium]
MNLFKRLVNLFSGGGGSRGDKRYLTVYALNRRCNEPVSGQVDLLNELSKPDEGEYAYYTRKVLHTTGERRCFSQVEINLYFNQEKQIVHHEVEGGRWLTGDEYAAELARFNAPPPEEDEEADSAEQTEGAGRAIPASSEPTQPKPTPEEDDDA